MCTDVSEELITFIIRNERQPNKLVATKSMFL
jgi:hypothetical protein